VVLTGGAVLLDGMTEFAEEILGMPVRLGVPVGVRGITQLVAGPQYATGVGLVQYGANALMQARERASAAADAPPRAELRKTTPAPRPDRASDRSREPEEIMMDPQKSGRFWSWLRAAF
jgi:cell division protein FtsA